MASHKVQADDEILLRLMNEIYILCNSVVLNQEYVLQLQGICWDVPSRSSPGMLQDDKVWPVLVFQKAPFGDLYRFAQGSIGQGIEFTMRWRICVEIGGALAHMQTQYIIHGYIKPENILIFKGEEDGDLEFTAKVADFGFSIWRGYESTSVTVPRSWPWYAPECDLNPRFTCSQAFRTDVFSYGLLCLWFIFEKHFSAIPITAEDGTLYPGPSNSSLRFLDKLKKDDTLLSYAMQLVQRDETLNATEKQWLHTLFSGSLACDPATRAADVWTLLSKVNGKPMARRETDLSIHDKELINNEDFKICDSLRHLYSSDYRVGIYILRQLEALAIQNPTVELSTQLAICYRLGFGVTDDKSRRVEHLLCNEEEVNRQILRTAEPEPGEWLGKLYQRLLKMGNHAPIYMVDYYEAHGVLKDAERTIRCEIQRLQEILGRDHRIVLILKDQLSSMLSYQSRWAEAEELHNELSNTKERILGEDHPDTLSSMANLASVYSNQDRLDKAEELYHKVLKTGQRVLHSNHTDIHTYRGNLAAIYWKQGRLMEAEALQEKILEEKQQTLGDEHPSALNSMLNLALMYREKGSLQAAEELETNVLRQRERTHGKDHLQTLKVMSNLAATCHSRGDWKRAEMLAATAVEKREKVLGREHPDTLDSKGILAAIYRDLAMLDAAESLQSEVAAAREQALGPDHRETLGSRSALATTYCMQGRWEEAQALQESVALASIRVLGSDHPNTLSTVANVATTYWNQGQYEAAEAVQQETLDRLTRLYGPAHPETTTITANLAATYLAMGRLEEAKDLQQEALTRLHIALGPEHPDTLNSRANLASIWHAMGEYAAAESVQRSLVSIASRILGPEHPQTLMNMHNLAATCTQLDQYAEARKLFGKILDVRHRVLGPRHSLTMETVEILASLTELPEDTGSVNLEELMPSAGASVLETS